MCAVLMLTYMQESKDDGEVFWICVYLLLLRWQINISKPTQLSVIVDFISGGNVMFICRSNIFISRCKILTRKS